MVLKKMKPVRSTLKFLFLPWIRLFGEGRQTAGRLRGLGVALIARAKENAAGAGTVEVLEQAKGPEDAFQRLYDRNGWTPERLAKQRREVRRAKWLSLILFWIAVCAIVGAAMSLQSRYALLFGIGLPCLLAFLMGLQTMRYALFQAQIDTRSLIRFSEFFSRRDFFLRLFS